MTSQFWTRRRFLLTAGAASASGAVGLYAWQFEPHWLEIVRLPLPVAGLPSSLAGRALVQISDVHVGLRVDDDYVMDTFRRVAELGPDIVVFTGDFVSYHPAVFPQARAIYRSMPRGRLATIGILGNHDYGPAWAHPEIAQELVDTLLPLGIHILRNEVADINGLQVIGLDDWWAHRFAPESVLPRVNPRGASLVLSHNPDTADRPGWGDYRGWILAGHTHGGQCKPPFLPPPLLPVQNRRYTAGEFALSGSRRMYISRGVGHLLHVRFNVRPEVTVFELSEA